MAIEPNTYGEPPAHIELNTQPTREQWDAFVESRPEASFLQSWTWGVFQQTLKKPVYRVLVMRNGVACGAASAVGETARRGPHAVIAGGPLADWNDTETIQALFGEIVRWAQTQGYWFVRFRPQLVNDQRGIMTDTLQKIGVRTSPAPMHVTADTTLRLNLTQSEDELMANMRKSTRYEVRRAEKLGITTSVSTDSADLETFYKHQLELAQKHGFVAFSQSFLTHQFETFCAENKAILVHAHQGKQLLASAFILLSNNEAVYHYGISTPENRSLPGAHACQWRAILEAKARGMQWYNFWGITKTENPKHRFYGVTIFKTGFGGDVVEYTPAQDIAISPMYQGTRLFEMLRRKIRHLEE